MVASILPQSRKRLVEEYRRMNGDERKKFLKCFKGNHLLGDEFHNCLTNFSDNDNNGALLSKVMIATVIHGIEIDSDGGKDHDTNHLFEFLRENQECLRTFVSFLWWFNECGLKLLYCVLKSKRIFELGKELVSNLQQTNNEVAKLMLNDDAVDQSTGSDGYSEDNFEVLISEFDLEFDWKVLASESIFTWPAKLFKPFSEWTLHMSGSLESFIGPSDDEFITPQAVLFCSRFPKALSLFHPCAANVILARKESDKN